MLDTYSGKSFVFEKLGGTFQYYGWKDANEDINQIVAVFERISDKKFFYIAVKNFKNDINILEQCKNKAEALFYISQAKEIQQSKEFLQNLLGGKTQLFQRI